MSATETIPPNEQGEAGDRNWKQMRDKVSKLEAQVAKYRSAAIAGAVSQAGFDPTSGITKLVVEKYEAGLDDDTELTSESFVEFAKGLGIEPPTSTTEEEAPPEESQDRSNEQQMDQLQNRSDGLREVVSEVPPPEKLIEQIQAAEQSGDVNASLALKMQLHEQQ